MVNHIYIPTNYKTRVDLLPHEIQSGKIDGYLLTRLKAKYEGRTIKDGNVLGYIKPGSLKLVDRGRAFMTGSHFTGTMCCNVLVNFELYTPVLNKTVEARVIKMTPIGFTAEANPLRIIVAKTTTFDQPNELFKDNIKPDLLIPIEILHYELRSDYIYAVGRLRPFTENYAKSYEIHIGNVLPIEDLDQLVPPPSLTFTTTVPKQDEAYGDPSQLNEAKDNLSDPDDPEKVNYWKYYMKQFLNDYEIIGNDRYFPNNLIFTISPMPFTRAYFKLVEILSDEEILKDFEDESINVLLLGEAPGGFIQAMIDTHPNPQDKLTGVTAPRDLEKGVLYDWNLGSGPNVPNHLKAAHAYLEKQRNVDLVTRDLTNPLDIIDIIKSFTPDEDDNDAIVKEKAQIITADGGIDVEENDNYNWQERMNYKLFYGEILTALGCQAVDGHFIMKIYDIYTDVTNQFIHLLANFYQTVTITKPKTSRPANSERYIVCKYFRGLYDFPIEDHLRQLDAWNQEDKNRNITVITPFLERKFYITSLIVVNLDSETTAQIKEKNQVYVQRQLEAIKKGSADLELLRGDYWDDADKTEFLTKRMSDQIRNSLLWCKEYLPANNCQPLPATNITYYQLPQGFDPRVGPLVPPDANTVSRVKGRQKAITETSSTSKAVTETEVATSTGPVSAAETQTSLIRAAPPPTRGSPRGRGSTRGSSRGSTRGTRGSTRGRGRGTSRATEDAEN